MDLVTFLFSFEGRVSRLTYFLWLVGQFIFGFLFALFLQSIVGPLSADEINGILVLVITWPALAIATKRLHDSGRSGWWLVGLLVPFLNIYVGLVILLQAGDEGSNMYGPAPGQEDPLHLRPGPDVVRIKDKWRDEADAWYTVRARPDVRQALSQTQRLDSARLAAIYLAHPDENVRLETLETFVEQEGLQAITSQALLDALADPSPAVRQAAAATIWDHLTGVSDILVGLRQRVGAGASALKPFQARVAVNALLAAAPEERAAAAGERVARIFGPDFLPAPETEGAAEPIAGGDDTVEIADHWGVADGQAVSVPLYPQVSALFSQATGDLEREELVSLYLYHPRPEVRLDVLLALSHIGPGPHLESEALIDALADDSPEVAWAAAELLWDSRPAVAGAVESMGEEINQVGLVSTKTPEQARRALAVLKEAAPPNQKAWLAGQLEALLEADYTLPEVERPWQITGAEAQPGKAEGLATMADPGRQAIGPAQVEPATGYQPAPLREEKRFGFLPAGVTNLHIVGALAILVVAAGAIFFVAGNDGEGEAREAELAGPTVGAAAATPSPRPTRAAPTLAAELPGNLTLGEAQQWPLVMADEFAGSTSDWTFLNDNETIDVSGAIVPAGATNDGGTYQWEMAVDQGQFLLANHPDLRLISLPEFYLAVTLGPSERPLLRGLALQVDRGSGSHIAVLVNHEGQLGVGRFDGQAWSQVTVWEVSPNWAPEVANRLGVASVEGTYAVYVNGRLEQRFEIEETFSGEIMLTAHLEAGQSAQVQFANFELRAPDLPDHRQVIQEVEDWPVVLESDFEEDDPVWLTGVEDSDPEITAERAVADGVLTWHISNERDDYNSSILWLQDLPPLADFYMAADVLATDPDGRNPDGYSAGLQFRVDPESKSFYTFELWDNFGYVIRLWQGDDVQQIASPHSAILDGETNRLAVLAAGPVFQLFINDAYIGRLDDETLAEGYNGLHAALAQRGEATIAFDNFILRQAE